MSVNYNKEKCDKVIEKAVDNALSQAFPIGMFPTPKERFMHTLKSLCSIRVWLAAMIMLIALPISCVTGLVSFLTFTWIPQVKRIVTHTNNMKWVQKVVEESGVEIPEGLEISYREFSSPESPLMAAECVNEYNIIFYPNCTIVSKQHVITLLKHELVHAKQFKECRIYKHKVARDEYEYTWEGETKLWSDWCPTTSVSTQELETCGFLKALKFQFKVYLGMKLVPWEKEAYGITTRMDHLKAIIFCILLFTIKFPNTFVMYWTYKIFKRFPKK